MDSITLNIQDIDFYVNRLKNYQCFSFAGYSDAEWYCMFGVREGEKTGLGQTLSKKHGKKLLDVMRRRQHDKRFFFAVPSCLWKLPEFRGNKINHFLLAHGIEIEAFERDIVTDDLAREAGLFPLIQQLQKMNVCIVGNKHLRGLEFLKYNQFVEISLPNLHLEEKGIDNAVNTVLGNPGPIDVFLVSAGVSAAVIIDQLHDKLPNSFFIDCGSIWDAFVGIGEQREWRKELYDDRKKLAKWKQRNLHGDKSRN